MHLADFDYHLPEELIAQEPAAERHLSRLLTVDRRSGQMKVEDFPKIIDHFRSDDLLIVNDTKVIPARLLGTKESGGRIEVFLVRRQDGPDEIWDCLTKSSKAPKQGSCLYLGEGLNAEVLEGAEPPHRRVRFYAKNGFLSTLQRVGRIPLPPYIRRDDDLRDRERYQTVFASVPGAVAAPTAGLHFTDEILARLRGKGVEICTLTLHVGLGTFLPVRVENILEHRMHGEVFEIPDDTALAVNQAKVDGRRVIALGTTATRALEYALDGQSHLIPGKGVSDLFIYPGFRFRIIDALITNFHLPKSTLLMLVSSFAGRELILKAYEKAVTERMRFFSYGDCMMIS